MKLQITNQEISDFLSKQKLIRGIDRVELSYLVDIAEKYVFEPGEIIFPEGELSNDLYFIYEGEVSLFKADSTDEKNYVIGTLKSGEFFGDLAFLDNEPRSVTVKAVTETTVLKISKETTSLQSSEMTNIYNKIMMNIAKITINRLRDSNVAYTQRIRYEIDHLMKINNEGRLFVFALFLNLFFSLSTEKEHFFFSLWTQTIIVAGILLGVVLKFYHPPHFGLSLKNMKRGIWNARLIYLGFVAVTFLAYLIGKYLHYIYPDIRWINFTSLEWNLALFSYPGYVILREFIFRGVMQTSLKDFLMDAKGLKTVFYTALIISTLSFPLGVGWMFASFSFNYLLSYYYNKYQNLLGVSLIHMTIGIILVMMRLIFQTEIFGF